MSCRELFLTREDVKTSNKGMRVLAVWVECEKCQISKCQRYQGGLAESRSLLFLHSQTGPVIFVYRDKPACAGCYFGKGGCGVTVKKNGAHQISSLSPHTSDTMSHSSKLLVWLQRNVPALSLTIIQPLEEFVNSGLLYQAVKAN